MQFILYTEPGTAPAAEQLPGLVHPDDCPLESIKLETAGPDTAAGGQLWHFADGTRLHLLPNLDYEPATQTWRKIGGTSTWVGWTTAAPPTPESLLRGDAARFGEWTIKLVDGNTWILPCQADIPVDYTLDDTGAPTSCPKREHLPTWQRMSWAFEQVRAKFEPDGPEPDAAQMILYAGEMLAVNYRLNPALAVLLGLLDPITVWQVCRVSTDIDAVDRLRDEVKKKERSVIPDTSVSNSGGPA